MSFTAAQISIPHPAILISIAATISAPIRLWTLPHPYSGSTLRQKWGLPDSENGKSRKGVHCFQAEVVMLALGFLCMALGVVWEHSALA